MHANAVHACKCCCVCAEWTALFAVCAPDPGLITVHVRVLLQALLMPRLVFLAAQSEARHYSLSDLDMRMGAIYL